jgi:hypothetical protein
MDDTSPPDVPGIPSDLMEAIVTQAKLDADRVSAFLRALGFPDVPDNPAGIVRTFLLELKAAFRLREWERNGIPTTQEFGLPRWEEALKYAFGLLRGDHDPGPQLFERVSLLFVYRFAWHARREWRATVAVGSFDDEASLDAVALFLWKTRHSRPRRPF